MNEARDLQHPDITAAEKTGYPWFPRTVTMEITEDDGKEYCHKNFNHFWDFLMVESPYTIKKYLDENEDNLMDWMGWG